MMGRGRHLGCFQDDCVPAGNRRGDSPHGKIQGHIPRGYGELYAYWLLGRDDEAVSVQFALLYRSLRGLENVMGKFPKLLERAANIQRIGDEFINTGLKLSMVCQQRGTLGVDEEKCKP
jgi:hypothetical protein